MKIHAILFASSLLLCALSTACSDDDSHDNSSRHECDASYTDRCSDDNTALLYCANGKIVSQKCLSACDPTTNACANAAECDSTFKTTCTNGNAQYCEAGKMKTTPCANGCDDATGMCKSASATCDIQESCSGSTHTYCNAGIVKTETCAYGCHETTNQCRECDDETFETKCETPHKLVSCVNGKLTTTTCKNGEMCNSEIQKKSCHTPTVGEKCNPQKFAEICYGSTVVRYCDEDTNLVSALDCTDAYGKGYKCDIAENYAGTDLDQATCYSSAEDCDTQGDVKYECTYEDSDDDYNYRQFITLKYLCYPFSTGLHYFLQDEIYCKQDTRCDEDKICEE